MNIVKIYNDTDIIPSYIIESIEEINSEIYIDLFDICKEEIYIDDVLIETLNHTK